MVDDHESGLWPDPCEHRLKDGVGSRTREGERNRAHHGSGSSGRVVDDVLAGVVAVVRDHDLITGVQVEGTDDRIHPRRLHSARRQGPREGADERRQGKTSGIEQPSSSFARKRTGWRSICTRSAV